MWVVTNDTIQIVEGDYGIQLPVKVGGTPLATSDSIKFTFKTAKNGDTILEKVYTDISQNTVNLEFTAAETELFPVGTYCYSMDWYVENNFMCNIIANGTFKVVDKA